MKNLIILASIFVAACSTTGTPPGVESIKIPDAPAELTKKAERLPDLVDPSFGGVMLDGAKTDALYNDVAWRHNRLVDFYDCVKTSINTKKDPKECFEKIK